MSTRTSKAIGMIMVVALAGIAATFLAVVLDDSRRDGGGVEYALMGMVGLSAIAWMLFRGPVGKGIASLFEGSTASESATMLRLAEVESRLAELEHRGLTSGEFEQAYSRLTDVEERVDFAERLLSQREMKELRNES